MIDKLVDLGVSFNPVLGFLSVSTGRSIQPPENTTSFNPVLGFLSVSTSTLFDGIEAKDLFQSRAGFSECLDRG